MKQTLIALASGIAIACIAAGAGAQGWSSQKNVEIGVGSAAGGSDDHVARRLERLFATHKLVPAVLSPTLM